MVLPVHNGMPHLDQAVQSILAQGFADFELVICNDGSNDGTAKVAAGYAAADPRVRVLSRPAKSGVAAAANWAVSAARAPLVAIMHADDIARPDRLQRQVAVFGQHRACVLHGAPADALNWHGDPAHPANLWRLASPSAFAPMAHSSIMLRKAAFDAVGGYRSEADYWEDLDLFWRLARLGQVLVSTAPLTIYRYSRTSIRQREASRGVERALQAMYARAAAVEGAPPAAGPEGGLHPRIFVARNWSRVWAGERAVGLGRLLREGRLRMDRATFETLVFLVWATVGPRSLRATLRLLTRLRNRRARRLFRGAEVLEWQPWPRDRV